MTRVGRVSTVLILALLAVARSSAAQAVVESFSDLPQVVHKGNVVFVHDEKGEGTKGKITDLSDATLQILTGGVREQTLTFSADRVTRISKIDSRWNGFIIGAIAGAIPGLLAGHWWSLYQYNENGGYVPAAYFLFGGIMGAAGGGIGYAIDGAIDGQTLVFRRPGVNIPFKF